jgi:hypothetical protein
MIIKGTKADSYLSCDYNSTILVLAGKQEQQFVVHKDAISAKSKFFRAACSERWGELRSSSGISRAIKLPETRAHDFQMYVSWVYATRMIELKNGDDLVSRKLLFRMYVLGDVLDDLQLRNAALEQLISSTALYTTQPNIEETKYVYENTPSGSALRGFLVEYRIGRGCREDFAKDVAKYPIEFIQEFAAAAFSKIQSSTRPIVTASLRNSFKPETEDA